MKKLDWKTWLALILIAACAGWMTFDGSRALLVGDYITQPTGAYAGQLGPWSVLVQALGLEPRSTHMELIFVLQGLITLTVLACFLQNRPWAQRGLLIAILAGFWYLPIGTLVSILAFILMLLTRRKARPPRAPYPMPDFVLEALQKRGLLEAYLARPPKQRNDYIGWITRARLNPTRQKRLNQMLAELRQGDIYMRMKWEPKPNPLRDSGIVEQP